jgi:hypothetical protein
MAKGQIRSNREAKKPKKLKPKEMAPVSTWIQKTAVEAADQKRNERNDYGVSDLGMLLLIVSSNAG